MYWLKCGSVQRILSAKISVPKFSQAIERINTGLGGQTGGSGEGDKSREVEPFQQQLHPTEPGLLQQFHVFQY